MFLKLLSVLKTCKYRLRYGSRIRFGGVPVLEGSCRINLKEGTVSVGRGLQMKPGAYFAVVSGGTLRIADRVAFGRDCIVVCHDSVDIGEGCAFGPHTLIYDHDHKFGAKGPESGYRTAPVVIERNCLIGAGVIILRGTHIGEGCVIGAGCVVSGTIPPHSLVTADRKLTVVPLEDRKQSCSRRSHMDVG